MKSLVPYCAFLRAINVQGSRIKMQALVQAFEAEHVRNVKAVLASGNVLFLSSLPKSELKSFLENRLKENFDFQTEVFLYTKQEIDSLLQSDPLEPSEQLHTYMVLSEESGEWLLGQVKDQTLLEGETLQVSRNHLYWQVPKNSTVDSRVSKSLARRAIKTLVTTRNRSTIEKISKQLTTIEP
ncbi:DUF1697 domain-containing protein [Chryseobacterium sp. A301]